MSLQAPVILNDMLRPSQIGTIAAKKTLQKLNPQKNRK